MIEVRPFDGLGHADHGWLDARHHFSFAGYLDRDRMGWGAIRVWNDDTIAPKSGFPPHSHSDMEIVTFVRTGALTHRDSLANEGRIAAGDVQVMSAGSGIAHAEYNLEEEPTTLFQIWIMTDEVGVRPKWGQRKFPRGARAGRWEILASGSPEADAELPLRADAKIAAAALTPGQKIAYSTEPSRHLYMVSSTGRVFVNGVAAQPRDGVAVTGEHQIVVEALDDAKIVLVDTR